MRLRSLLFCTATLTIVVGPFACSSDKATPPPVNVDRDGAVGDASNGPVPEAGDGEAGDAAVETSTKDANLDVITGDAGPATCLNNIKDSKETDVDCGGDDCQRRCNVGQACSAQKDCAQSEQAGAPPTLCSNGRCASPACTDGQKTPNTDETDVDCGGKVCGLCALGKGCTADSDCSSRKCNTTSKLCACPERMVEISLASGGAYCMDEFEVTAGDYDRFIKSNQPVQDQIAECVPNGGAGNATFIPSGDWPPSQPIAASYSLPVRYVDWCDAYAFCRWSGKELCGRVGPTVVADAGATDERMVLPAENATTKSAWFNACSAQGQNAFPYGSAFVTTKCNVLTHPDAGANAAITRVASYQPSGAYQALDVAAPERVCQGGFTGLYNMSGNLAEWENSCTATECSIRGGSFKSDGSTDARCTSAPATPKTTRSAEIGIRCCSATTIP